MPRLSSVADAGKDIRGENQVMDQSGAVDRVFAVITGVVMAAADVDFAGADERVKAGVGIFELRRCVAWIFLGRSRDLRDDFLGALEFEIRNFGGSGVAGIVNESRKGQDVVRAAALVVKTERVSAREIGQSSIIYLKRIRGTHSGNTQPIGAPCVEFGKIGLINELIRCGRISEAAIRTGREISFENAFAICGVNDLEGLLGGNFHFAEAAKVIADHRLFRELGLVADFVDVDGGIEAKRIGFGRKRNVFSPKIFGVVLHDNLGGGGDGVLQFQI